MGIVIVCQPGCDVINFEINLMLLIELLFYMTKKSRKKIKNLENKNSFEYEIKTIVHCKACLFIVFEGFSLKQIKQIFLEGGSTTLKVPKDESLLIKLKNILIKSHGPCFNLSPWSYP